MAVIQAHHLDNNNAIKNQLKPRQSLTDMYGIRADTDQAAGTHWNTTNNNQSSQYRTAIMTALMLLRLVARRLQQLLLHWCLQQRCAR